MCLEGLGSEMKAKKVEAKQQMEEAGKQTRVEVAKSLRFKRRLEEEAAVLRKEAAAEGECWRRRVWAAELAAVARAVEGPRTPTCPASLLQDHAACTFMLDRAAARGLSACYW